MSDIIVSSPTTATTPVTTTVVAVPTSTPLSDSLKRQLDAQITAIKSQRGQANLSLTRQGAEFGIGTKFGTKFGEVTTSAYAMRWWNGGWDAGIRGGISF